MRQQLIIGMPASGKSTFLAALAHVLIAKQIDSQLELTALSDNEKHLSGLETRWLSCEEVPRTKPATEAWVELNVRDRETSVESKLLIPDLRGEAYAQPACFGQCQRDIFEVLTQADGVVLFTNVDRANDTLLISDLDSMFEAEAESKGCTEAEGLEDQLPVAEPANFRPEDMPEEVKLVELLQLANRKPNPQRRRRIAVMLSAWDVVDAEADVTPQSWFEDHRPMLSQYLGANLDLWDARVYGISAQGGRLPAEKQDLEKHRRPSERIRVVGHDAGKHDLTAPLRWLMA